MLADPALYRSKFTWKEIKDPVHNYIWFNREIEEKLINTHLVQRLRYILQLQTAHLVYPGAVHTRFQHSIGVMHLGGAMAEDMVAKLTISYGRDVFREQGGHHPAAIIEAVRLAGLFHDIGHAAFGHAFEAAVLWNPVFSNRIPVEANNHEKIGYLLVRSLEDEIIDMEKKLGLPGLWDLLTMILGEEEQSGIVGAARSLIKDSLYPADILDYLQRDSYYTGTREYGYIDHQRLIENTHPYLAGEDVLLVLDRKALGELRRYLIAKAGMYEHVYFHQVNRAFDKLLQEIIVKGEGELFHLVDAVRGVARGEIEDYLMITDAYMYARMLEAAARRSDELGRLCKNLLITRKPLWKRIGREYRILPHQRSIGGGEEGSAILAILRLAFYREEREKTAKAITEHIYDKVKGMGVTDPGDLWVDIVTISPIPTSMLIGSAEKPSLLAVPVGKHDGRRIVYDGTLNLVEEGMPLAAIIRVYIRRGLYRHDLEPRISQALEEAVREMLRVENPDYTRLISSIKIEEHVKAQKITA